MGSEMCIRDRPGSLVAERDSTGDAIALGPRLYEAPIDGAALTDALTKYFRGLCLAVGAGKFSFDPKHFQTSLSQGGPDDGLPGATYQGQVDSYDAFTTGAPLTLRVRAHVFECPAANHQVVLIGASPAANPAPIWGELSKLLSSFHCG